MSFTQGVSGLHAAAADLDNIGNNIANSQTNGFKSGRTQFADIYASAQKGLGVSVAGITQNFSAGSLENTNRDLDMAIDGDGFFRLSNNGSTQYSRDGSFALTKNGTLANSSGALLTGYNVNNFNSSIASPQINTNGTPQVIQLPDEGLNARATTHASLSAGLDAGTEIHPDFDSGSDFNAEDASTYDWATPNTVYDSLGNAHNLNLYFTKTDENQWAVNGQMPLGGNADLAYALGQQGDFGLDLADFDSISGGNGSPLDDGNGTYTLTGNDGTTYIAKVTGTTDDGNGGYTGGKVTYSQQLPQVQLDFDTSGNLTKAARTANPDTDLPDDVVNYTLGAQNGSAPLSFDFDFGGSTQTAQSFTANSPSQDGYASGALTGVSVEDNGVVTGHYDNGQSVGLAQVVLASFRNEQGLSPVSGNSWVETGQSGQPALGTAGSGKLGSLRGGTLESSNVDLSQQLVDMIVAQRDYQANAQTIKTQDQIMQTVVHLG